MKHETAFLWIFSKQLGRTHYAPNKKVRQRRPAAFSLIDVPMHDSHWTLTYYQQLNNKQL